MSKPYFFRTQNRCEPEEVAERFRRIAEEHGATFINARMPDGGRSWFQFPELGTPFNEAKAERILAAIGEAEDEEE